MNATDAVSCLLCLQPDEYGSMIKVCVPPGRIPPSSEKVICRRCAGAILKAGEQADEPLPESGFLFDPSVPDRPLETKVEGGETDENENYVSGERLPKSDTGND
jgi:hypothetical protein